jgi:hypothetical protein
MRSQLRAILAVLVAAVVCGLCSVADATTVVLLSRAELVAKSDTVARVTVGEAVSTESDDGTMIVTRTALTVTQLLKGSASGTLQLEQIGGTYKGKTQKISGDAVLVPGEDAVVFLKSGDKGRVYLTALALAAYHVDAKGMVHRDLGGMTLMKKENGRFVPTGSSEPAETIDHLMTDVVNIAGGK